MPFVAARRGTSGACAPAPHPPGRRSSAPPIIPNFTPTSGAVIVGGVEMAASLPGVISCSRPRATGSLPAVADTGAQVSVRVAYFLGDLGISQRQLQATPTTVTHVLPGAACDSWEPSPVRSPWGLSPPQSCIYIAEGVQQLYLSLKACKALPWSITPSRAPFHPPVCVLSSHQTPHKTHVPRNRHLTNL
ncbi:hypothetical protein GWK47_028886 [Chionoecetes opilio]|uniref:Uncharacterized protein n=1 Tax=Chionoecetes opilio TaxID=41210 RepID=A0A8J4Z4M2_CHIOP|nr:hypothetical protein GWK47_028886 [Chionoecetes opilio]